MDKFVFDFTFDGETYEAECQPFQLDGKTELHVTPHDPDLFEKYGKHVLWRDEQGNIIIQIASQASTYNYLTSLANGLSIFFDDQIERS